uniref:MADS-box transcription factor 25 n=1 Tax=Aegilops tauschii TaxID=37682 RepID=M8CY18_AEGTA
MQRISYTLAALAKSRSIKRIVSSAFPILDYILPTNGDKIPQLLPWMAGRRPTIYVVGEHNGILEGQHGVGTLEGRCKLWQREVTTLRRQVQNLHHNNRQLLGEELSGTTVRDLQFLVNQVEMSLHSIRKRKEQVMAAEIHELNQKGLLVQKENIELDKKLSIAHEQNIELRKQLSAAMKSSEQQACGSSSKAAAGLLLSTRVREPNIDLELRQQEHEDE